MKKITIYNCFVRLNGMVDASRKTQILQRLGVPLGFNRIHKRNRPIYDAMFYVHTHGGIHYGKGNPQEFEVSIKTFFLLWYEKYKSTHRMPDINGGWLLKSLKEIKES